MEFRFEKTAAVIGVMFAVVAAGASQQLTIEIRHDHFRGEGRGALTATDSGLSFQERGGKDGDHHWSIGWPDIQQLWIAPRKLRVLTYSDAWWKLGMDREYELEAAAGADFTALYESVKSRMDQRLVAALGDDPGDVLWQIPAKRRERFGGPEGVLLVGSERVVFKSPENGASRTWRLADIENVSTSGPFDLTLTTFERSKTDYGSRKAFDFQLKAPLDEGRYNALWRRIHQEKQPQ
jgi:hypothetical protein